jgi:hypothetical protein
MGAETPIRLLRLVCVSVMTKLLFVTLVALTACGGSKSQDTSTGPSSPVGGPGEPSLDPTLPSWAPASCTAYQKAVFQAINCEAVDKGKRDEIEASYNKDLESWKTETEATEAKVEEVNVSCTASTESVRTAIGDACTVEAK